MPRKLRICWQEDFSQTCTDLLVNQQKVENIEEFMYLGSSIHYQGDMDHALNWRIGKVQQPSASLGNLKENEFPRDLNYFYYSIVLSMLLYGPKTLHLKVSQEKRLDGFDSKCLWGSLAFLGVTMYQTRRSACGPDACQYHQRSASNAWTGWLMCADFQHHDQWTRYCTGFPQSRWERLKMNWWWNVDWDLWLVNHPEWCAHPCQEQKKLIVFWLHHVSQDTGATKLS